VGLQANLNAKLWTLPGVVAYSPCSKLPEGYPYCNQFVGYWALKSETKTIVGSKALRLEIYTSTPAIINEIKVSYVKDSIILSDMELFKTQRGKEL
jgi:hypothetical protein